MAVDYTWTGLTNNTWANAGNWGGTAPVNAATTAVFFGTAAASRLSPNLAASGTVGNVTFNTGANAFTISRGSPATLTLTTGASVRNNSTNTQTFSTAIVLAGSSTWNAASGNLSVSGVMSGASGSLTKTGTGTLSLTGANTYAGGTTISEGTLQVGNGGRLGTGGVINNGVLTYNSNATVTEANIISGTGRLNQIGTGILALTGSNSYQGGTTISAGTLQFSTLTNFGSGTVALNGGSLRWATGNTADVSGIVNLSGGALDTNGNNVTLGSALSGTGSVIKAGTGTLTLSVLPTSSGFTVNGGALRLGSSGTMTGAVVVGGTGNNTAGAVLDLNGGDLTVGSLQFGTTVNSRAVVNTVSTGTGTLMLAGDVSYVNATTANNHAGTSFITGNLDLGETTRTFNLANSSNTAVELSISAAIIGAGGINKTGAGTLEFTGTNNTYAGPTVLSDGALRISSASNLPSTSNLQFNGGLVELGSDLALVSGTGEGQVQWTGGGGFSTTGGNRTINYNSGAGVTWATSDFAANGTAFVLGAASSDGTVTFSNNIDLNGGDRTITVNNGSAATDAVLSGTLSNGTGLTVNGNGTVLLGDDNSFTGTMSVVNSRVLVSKLANSGSNSSIGAGTSIQLTNGTLRYTGTGDTTDRFIQVGGTDMLIESQGTGAIAFTNTNSVVYGTPNTDFSFNLEGNNTGNNIFAGSISDNGTGIVRVNKDGAGTWTLSGSNSFSYVTYVYQGILSVANDYALGAGKTSVLDQDTVVLSGATINLNNVNIGVENISVGGSGVGGLGALTSTGTSSFGGVLQAQGDLTINVEGQLSLTGYFRQSYAYRTLEKIGSGTLAFTGTAIIDNFSANIREGTLLLAKNAGSGYAFNGTAVRVFDGATLRLGGTGSDQISYVTVVETNSGGLFDLNGRNESIGGLSGTSGLVTNSAVGTTSTISVGYAEPEYDFYINSTYGGTLRDGVGVLALWKSFASTLAITGSNSYSGGTTINNGILIAGNNSAFGTGAITFNSGQLRSDSARTLGNALRLNGSGTIGGTSNLTFTNTLTNSGGNRTLTVSNTGTTTLGGINLSNDNTGRTLTINTSAGPMLINGPITNGGNGAGSLIKSGTGTLILSGSASHTGGTSIIGGRLQVGNGGTTGSLGGDVALSNGGTLAFHRSDAVSFGGTITGDGSVFLLGGEVTLLADNSYTGTTTIAAGHLLVEGNLTGTGQVNVTGGAIGGDGEIGGSLHFGLGAGIVFNSTKTLTINGATVSFDGFSMANIIGLDSTVDLGTYTLLDGPATFDFTNVSNFGSDNLYSLGDGKYAYFESGSLALIVVPEPSIWALLGLGTVVIAMSRRRFLRSR